MCHRRCSKAYVKKVGTLGSSVPNMFLCHSVKKKKIKCRRSVFSVEILQSKSKTLMLRKRNMFLCHSVKKKL